MSKSIYFKNLNSLRFIAALFVIIHHLEQFKSIFNLPNHWSNPFIHEVGGLGVTLFFVLSGFLITYLLLEEKIREQTISIKDFYLRRILRIWPLYYLIVFLGFFILPNCALFALPVNINSIESNFGLKLFFFIIFLPNLANQAFPLIPFVSQSWSVGVEEQFYLIWPLLVKKFKHISIMLLIVPFLYLLLKYSLIHFSIKLPEYPLLKIVSSVWDNFRIDCMAIGGMAAFILFQKKEQILKVLYHKFMQVFIYFISVYLIATGCTFPHFSHEIYAVIFAIIILNLASNPKSILNLEFKFLNYLGKISYGLYMYHSICIVFCIKLILYFDIKSALFLWALVLITSIIVSLISYELLEKRFIKLKIKYTKILSGEN